VNVKYGRAWAYIGTLMGVSVSSAANLMETLNNEAVPAAWAWIAAIFMGLLPVGLFVSLEVLVRNRIKDHLNWWRLGMMVAATSFAVPSYLHMHWLMLDWGQGDVIALVYPIGWDAMMLLSTLALLLDPVSVVMPAKEKVKRSRWGRRLPVVAAAMGEKETKPPVAPPVRPDGAKQRRLKVGSDPLYAEFVARSKTPKPMTVEDLQEADGKGFHSARSKLNRWKKTLENA
jgi:hypothetical protein